MSKLGLSTGENRCVIKFKVNYPSTHDSGTFETPVWWCTKDGSDYFNVPEQFYMVILYQNTSYAYLSTSSRLSVYSTGQYSNGYDLIPLQAQSNNTTYSLHELIWICRFNKFKINIHVVSGGIVIDAFAAVIPL